jgi:hypothetical protein
MSYVEIETNVSFCWYGFHDGVIIPIGLRETPRGLESEITFHSRTIQFSDRPLSSLTLYCITSCAASLVDLALTITKPVSSRLLVLELLQRQGVRAVNSDCVDTIAFETVVKETQSLSVLVHNEKERV